MEKGKVYQLEHQILFLFLAIKNKKTPDTSIIRKQYIQEPVNPRKRGK